MNKWIRLIKYLIQDISNISLLFEFHTIVFIISKITGFTTVFCTLFGLSRSIIFERISESLWLKILSKILVTLVRCLNFIQLCSVFRKLSGLQAFFYIDLNIIRIIEVHNFRTNKWIRLIKDLVQDISNISPLFEFHSIVFSISEISWFTSFFFTLILM